MSITENTFVTKHVVGKTEMHTSSILHLVISVGNYPLAHMLLL